MANRKNRDQRGFTLIELLITVTVLSFGLLGLAGLQVEMVRANDFNRNLLIAQNIGADLLEESKGMDKYDSGTNTLTDLSGNILYTTLTHDFADPGRKVYGDSDNLTILDPGDIDVDGDGAADTLYNNRFSWTRTIAPAGASPGKCAVEVTVFWPDRFSATPKQMSFRGIAPQG